MLPIRILGTGKYLPKTLITADQLDKKAGLRLGTTLRVSGVETRHFIEDETASMMGAAAAKEALTNANLTIQDIDCIICSSGTHEQAMPATAALISEQFGALARGIPAFDVNSTCLSFLTGLDLLSYAVQQGRYRNVLIVASEIASVGLDWKDKESCTLFGDGAAAAIIRKSNDHEGSKIIAANMETYSEGAHFTEIPGGGTRFHPRHYLDEDGRPHLFRMNGRNVYKLSIKILPDFVEQLFQAANMSMNDIKLVIPHQASVSALRLIAKRLNIPEEKLLITVKKYGNTVAASIPLALHDAITQKQIVRGDKILLVGTAAGLTVGGMIIEY
jgi:3-oxoacyl-[acyl-carrier-protein] synthase-3